MRWRAATRAAAVAGVLCATTAPTAAAPQPTTFTLTDRHIAQPVDWLTWCGDCAGIDYTTQQPWVTNPTTCMWDTDDYYTYANRNPASWLPGTAARVDECDYESWTSGQNGVIHVTDVDFRSPSPDLLITETFTSTAGAATVAVTPVWVAADRAWRYKACVVVPQQTDQPTVQIAGSNGGQGVPVAIRVTVTNPTAHKIDKTTGIIEFGWQQFYRAGCKYPPGDVAG